MNTTLSNHQMIALSLLNGAFYMAGVCGLMDLIKTRLGTDAVEEVVMAVVEMCEAEQHAPAGATIN